MEIEMIPLTNPIDGIHPDSGKPAKSSASIYQVRLALR